MSKKIMNLRKSEIIITLLIIVSFATGASIYPVLPNQVASHWNMQGEVDGYMSRFWGAFFMPILSLAMGILFYAVPRIDPKRKNIEKFRVYFDGFIIIMFLFLLYLYLLTIVWNLGYQFELIIALSPAFAVLYYYVGILMSYARPNWSIGIRTPWTLSSALVWDKTHDLSAKLFRLAGLFALVGIILPSYAFLFIVIPALIISVTAMLYSYLEYRKIHGKS